MIKQYKRIIGSRLIVTAIAVLIQMAWLWGLLKLLAPYALMINVSLTVLAVIYVLSIASKREEPAYKVFWLIVILAFPIFGTILYLCFGNGRTSWPLRKRLARAKSELPPLTTSPHIMEELKKDSPRTSQTFQYLSKLSKYPTYINKDARYYPLGDNLYPAMLEALEHAERFIYLEYFIVDTGEMWNCMLDILERKAISGVDIRMIYDDMGSLTTLPPGYADYLRKRGIQCISFNPMKLILSGTLNNRDHRKILIVDGTIAFSGGINLTDEYINRVVKYGHWKDVGFRIEGPAVRSYVQMFAEFWNAFSTQPITLDPMLMSSESSEMDGYVHPYYDMPTKSEAISNHIYMELLDQATRYAWFFTPYLMLGDTLIDAFVRAAQRGVDIRIYIPGVPDKKIIYRITQSFFRPLLEAGIHIYTYTPGFLHAKACLVDDIIGTLGTVNLDFRSLFLHFECNSLFYRASLLKDLKEDFVQTHSLCKEVSLEERKNTLHRRLFDSILRIIAPLC